MGAALHDARLQLHHAAQLATAAGISYLPPAPDDSHTNLEWIPAVSALASHVVPAPSAFRVAVRPRDLAVLLLDADSRELAMTPLHGLRLEQAADWIRKRVDRFGAEGKRFTLKRHYEIPSHAVEHGGRFDASHENHFEQLGIWYANAWGMLEELRAADTRAAAVRCWPHHFDLATLIDLGGGATIGVGLEPGDTYYDEPYFYVNRHPSPTATMLAKPLAGEGRWHRHEWTGAVLPASDVRAAAAEAQDSQVRAFLTSAVAIFSESA